MSKKPIKTVRKLISLLLALFVTFNVIYSVQLLIQSFVIHFQADPVEHLPYFNLFILFVLLNPYFYFFAMSNGGVLLLARVVWPRERKVEEALTSKLGYQYLNARLLEVGFYLVLPSISHFLYFKPWATRFGHDMPWMMLAGDKEWFRQFGLPSVSEIWATLVILALAMMAAFEARKAFLGVRAGTYGTNPAEVKEIARALIKRSKSDRGGSDDDGLRGVFPGEPEAKDSPEPYAPPAPV